MTSGLEPTRTVGDDDASGARSGVVWAVAAVVLLLLAGGGWYLLRPPAPIGVPRGEGPLQPASASVSALDGSVKLKTVGDVMWTDARLQEELREKDLVRTGVRSTADISFVDSTLVNVRPESLITIQPPAAAAAGESSQRRAAWHISSGEVNFQRQADEGSAEVSTPTVRSTISERASANIRVEAGGDSDIRLFAGRGRVETTAGESVELRENEGLRVDAAGNAGPKLKLPPAPALSSPAAGAALPEAVPPRDPLRLGWAAVPGALAYRAQVASDVGFAAELTDLRSTSTGVALPRLERGSYFWRVAAVAEEGAEGAFSQARSFTVVAPPAGPALEIASLEVRGAIAQIQGRTLPGTRLTVDGNDVPVQVDGSFDEFVTLRGRPSVLVVRAVAPDGGVSQVERPLTRR